MVAGLGFEPRTFGLCVPLQLSLLRQMTDEFVVWTISSPCFLGEGARRLVSTPSSLRYEAWLGITSKGFTEFDGYSPDRFRIGQPRRTTNPIFLCSYSTEAASAAFSFPPG